MAALLDEIKVLEVGFLVAGPGASRLLADYGATVVKLEPPNGDASRGGWLDKMGSGRSVQFELYNRGKLSTVVDLNTPEGQEVLRDLIRWADIVLTNLRPRFFERIGLGWEAFHAVNPRAVLGVVSTFGLGTSEENSAGGDVVAQAESGIPHFNGEPGGPPVVEIGSPADAAAAAYMFGCLLAAHISSQRTGEGRLVDLAIVDAYTTMDVGIIPSVLATHGEFDPGRCGRFHPLVTPHGVFKAKVGWIVISAYGSGPHGLWPRLARVMGRDELADAPGYLTDNERSTRRDEIVEMIESWLATFDDDETPVQMIRDAGVVCARILSPKDALEGARQRGRLLRHYEHPTAGTLEVIGIPAQVSDFDFQPGIPPALGQHTDAVLAEKLGYTPDRIKELRAAGILGASE